MDILIGLIPFFIIFGVMFLISTVLNILLKTTSKDHWAITFLLSLGLSIVFTAVLYTV